MENLTGLSVLAYSDGVLLSVAFTVCAIPFIWYIVGRVSSHYLWNLFSMFAVDAYVAMNSFFIWFFVHFGVFSADGPSLGIDASSVDSLVMILRTFIFIECIAFVLKSVFNVIKGMGELIGDGNEADLFCLERGESPQKSAHRKSKKKKKRSRKYPKMNWNWKTFLVGQILVVIIFALLSYGLIYFLETI